jgi:hypothetical protein
LLLEEKILTEFRNKTARGYIGCKKIVWQTSQEICMILRFASRVSIKHKYKFYFRTVKRRKCHVTGNSVSFKEEYRINVSILGHGFGNEFLLLHA